MWLWPILYGTGQPMHAYSGARVFSMHIVCEAFVYLYLINAKYLFFLKKQKQIAARLNNVLPSLGLCCFASRTTTDFFRKLATDFAVGGVTKLVVVAKSFVLQPQRGYSYVASHRRGGTMCARPQAIARRACTPSRRARLEPGARARHNGGKP